MLNWFNELNPNVVWYGEISIRLLLALILGGLVGYEREQANRPAGFRTHILVSLGSALVMVMAEYMTRYYHTLDIDPTRLGAQVITGIGFLGAGTIIRNGSSVRGLTTAASIWMVSCIGLAAGTGFYFGALLATAFTFLTLISLKQIERRLAKEKGSMTLTVMLTHYNNDVGQVLEQISIRSLQVHHVEIQPDDPEDTTSTRIRLQIGLNQLDPDKRASLMHAIEQLDTVVSAALQ
jgi:putative Mg2+ transporter-C (MgtC) family protein